MIEYHDILWDLGYPKEWGDPTLREGRLYGEHPPVEAMYEWRDARVIDEIQWYGWFIDYWMEAGLLRDIFTHKLVTLDHWNDLLMRPFFNRADLAYDRFGDSNADVTPTYDPHCLVGGDISNGCEPVEVISADKIVDETEGPAETARVANALLSNTKTGAHIIGAEAWPCIWEETIMKKKGPKNIYSRPGYVEGQSGFNFSKEMLEEMVTELNRLITKYSGAAWTASSTANRLVKLLEEHLFVLQMEVNEIESGQRTLRNSDILGPKTRDARKARHVDEGDYEFVEVTKDHFDHFNSLGQHYFIKRRRTIRRTRQREKNAREGEKMKAGASA